MDNFDLKKYLVENKVTTNSRMMNEYFEKETQDLAEAFAQAGIDMNTAVEVVEAGGGPGGSMGEPKKMSSKALLQMLEKEKASFDEDSDEGEEVIYDFEAAEGYPGAKLAVMFGDQFEYIIYQETSSSKMMNEAAESKVLFDFPEGEESKDHLNYEKLGFKVTMDDYVNDILYAESDLTNYDWMAVLSVLEDAARYGLHPMLSYNGKEYSSEEAMRLADEKAAGDTHSDTSIRASSGR